jgi:hypothetical protein
MHASNPARPQMFAGKDGKKTSWLGINENLRLKKFQHTAMYLYLPLTLQSLSNLG